ncbi:MAG: rhomboid family intramembrane serine protease [Phycisphaerae bacterium]
MDSVAAQYLQCDRLRRSVRRSATRPAVSPGGCLSTMLIPIRTDTQVRRIPYVNYGLIAACVLIHALVAMGGDGAASWRRPLMLWPLEPRLMQFLSYQFLHGDVMHLAGNMLFLWVFGNAVNARMGHFVYALFYLAGGVLAGVGFVLSGGDNPCLGASGAIAAVTTAYLVLFPRSEITIFYWFFFVGVVNVNALWFILGKVILWDNLLAMNIGAAGVTSVAYAAHVSGYCAGFVIALLLLLTRSLPRDHFDLLSIWRRARQRQVFADMMSDPTRQAHVQYGRVARVPGAPAEAAPPPPLARPADPNAALRDTVIAALARGDHDAALERFAELVERDPQQVLAQRAQLEIANRLAARQAYSQAAAAYENYLRHYPAAVDRGQVKLLLGIVYARHLRDFARARPYLSECAAGLPDPVHRSAAQHWLDEMGSAAPTA